MSCKLAIAISGAVSLGSYEAGVMYEVLEAIAIHNENLADDDPNRIEIDVITGASAGGMTAGILAQKLLCEGEKLRGAYTNPLYESWVQEVDIGKLLVQNREEYKFSLLSSKVVESIGEKYIKNFPTIAQPHPSAASTIHVGIAMSNLNGWDYIVRPLNKDGDGEFIYTRYKDRFVCQLSHVDNNIALSEISLSHKEDVDGGDIDKWVKMHPTNWQKLRECSLSSGAFPFAFEAKKITRCPGKGEFSNREGNTYTYTDGGVFENEPLGLAKKLAEWIDAKAKDEESKRFYLYVAPGNKNSTANSNFGRDEQVDLWTTLKSLISAIFHQARFQDWIIKDLDSQSPIFQITVPDKELIGELLFAFAGFLDIRFRHFDYNIGRESARAALEKFSKEPTNNPKLVHWKDKDADIIWECIPSKPLPATTSPVNEKDLANEEAKQPLPIDPLPVKRTDYAALAKGNSIDALLGKVDRDKRVIIFIALRARVMALIDFVNEKLDEEDRKKSVLLGSVLRLLRRSWTVVIVKPTVWVIAGRFLRRKLLP